MCMEIDLKKWKEFVREQNTARKKVLDRLLLWEKENPLPNFNVSYAYDFWKLDRDREEFLLNNKFGVVNITFENFLNRL